ncbi:ATP-binding cassette domain-containing protein [Nocardia bovistercoris]|uniref:ATP-binding cassette domain-containing protein n=1 Tax=Nocardia bovistercoris TaxID=2785916 RepID=A0A931IFT7_9NOCA|nr:ATP-binding cassette domain-containing protein [Nocardia bovistercoris]MBH0780536.1 ATP-binding cassette domain-containing protein [Nocardia bovistercoris]
MQLIRFLLSISRVRIAGVVATGLVAGAANTYLVTLINSVVAPEPRPNDLLPRFALTGIVLLVSGLISQILLIRLAQDAILRLRSDLSAGVVSAPLEHLERLGAHRLIATLTEDVRSLSQAVTAIPAICIDVATIVGCFVFLAILSGLVFAITVAGTLIGICCVELFLRRVRSIYHRARENEDLLLNSFQAVTLGIKELKLHRGRRKDFMERHLIGSARTLRDQNVDAGSKFSVAQSLGQVLQLATMALILFGIAKAIDLPRDVVVGYVLVTTFLAMPMQNFMHRLPDLVRGDVALAKIRAMNLSMETQHNEDELPFSDRPAASDARLELAGVTYAYAGEIPPPFPVGPGGPPPGGGRPGPESGDESPNPARGGYAGPVSGGGNPEAARGGEHSGHASGAEYPHPSGGGEYPGPEGADPAHGGEHPHPTPRGEHRHGHPAGPPPRGPHRRHAGPPPRGAHHRPPPGAGPGGRPDVNGRKRLDHGASEHRPAPVGAPTATDDGSGFTLGPIDLVLEPGQITFIVGGNGSGKSTLAKLITGLYVPKDGAVALNGERIDHENIEWFRQNSSAVFTDFHLFEDYLGFDEPGLDDKVRHYLEQLQIAHKVTVRNGKLSTVALSQGQRKRLALLTALLEDRQIYVFDEWAADQEPRFREVFYGEILTDLKRRGKTVIVITHDDRYFDRADQLVKLEFGQITAATDAIVAG